MSDSFGGDLITIADEEGNEYYENFDGSYSDDYGATYQISGGNFDY